MTADLHRLLVPLDRSCGGAPALDIALRHARSTNGTVTLLAVAPVAIAPAEEPAIGPSRIALQDQRELDRLAQEQLDEVAAGLPGGVDVRTRLTWGPVGQAIVDEASTGDHDLVVVAWHHTGAIGHLLRDHNQTARHVLDHCGLPVLVAPSRPGGDDT